MANVGYATLTVIPSARGFTGALRRELSGADAVSGGAGASAARSFGGRFAAGVGSMVHAATTTLVAGMTVAGTIAGAALVKGFGRLTTIEDSTRALALTLGDAAKAGELLGQVLTVVKGTPFALDQFAAGAQQLVGFGVQAEKVPGILTAVGDASATQGKRAGEFAGRLIEVFGQIAAKGRIQLEDVWRISETGVNALQILANHFGLNTKEMQDLISKGAVPAGEAMDALVAGIERGSNGIAGSTRALGGLAQTLGTTLSGSFANFLIAFTRAGANVLAPFSAFLTSTLQQASGMIDKVGAALSARASAFMQGFDAGAFLQFVDGLPQKLRPVLDGLKSLGPLLAPLAGLLAGIASTNLAAALGPLGALVPAISPLAGLFIGLVAASPELRDALAPLVPILSSVAQTLGAAFADAVSQLLPALPPLGEALVSIASSLAAIFVAVSPLIPDLVALAVPLLQIAAGVIAWADSMNILTPILATALGLFVAWKAALAAQAIFTAAAAAIGLMTGAVAAFNLAVLANPIGIAVVAIAVGAYLIVKHWDTIKAAAAAAFNWVKDNWPLILAILTGPIGIAVAAIVKNWDTIKSTLSNALAGVTELMRSIPGRVRDAVGDLGSLLVGAGKAIISGLIAGIKSSLGPLGTVLGGVGKFIKDNKGPLDYDLRLLVPAGTAIMDGLIRSIRDRRPLLRSVLAAVTADVTSNAPQMAVAGGDTALPARGGSAGAAYGPVIGSLTVHASGREEGHAAAQVIVDTLTRHFRNGGAKPPWAA